jgi:hypothetical protein
LELGIGRDNREAQRHRGAEGGVAEAANSLPEDGDVEVHEEANGVAGELQVGDDLSFMNWKELLDRFDLQDQKALHEHIDPISTVEREPLVAERNFDLPVDFQLSDGELVDQAAFIGGLE